MSKPVKLIAAVLVAAAALVIVAWWLFYRGDTPEEVSIESATAQLDADLAADDAAADQSEDASAGLADATAGDSASAADGAESDDADPEAAAGTFDGQVDGTWVVDDDIGSFDFDTASGSFAGFRVDEELTVGSVVAVGRSGGVSGSLTISDGVLSAAEVTVDMTVIVSNDARREFAIAGAVGASEHPEARFVLSGPVALPDGLAAGEEITARASGDLTVKGVTNPVVFAISALVRDDGLGVVIGSAEIAWEDFGVTPPSAPIVVSVEPEGIVEFQLIVRKT